MQHYFNFYHLNNDTGLDAFAVLEQAHKGEINAALMSPDDVQKMALKEFDRVTLVSSHSA